MDKEIANVITKLANDSFVVDTSGKISANQHMVMTFGERVWNASAQIAEDALLKANEREAYESGLASSRLLLVQQMQAKLNQLNGLLTTIRQHSDNLIAHEKIDEALVLIGIDESAPERLAKLQAQFDDQVKDWQSGEIFVGSYPGSPRMK